MSDRGHLIPFTMPVATSSWNFGPRNANEALVFAEEARVADVEYALHSSSTALSVDARTIAAATGRSEWACAQQLQAIWRRSLQGKRIDTQLRQLCRRRKRRRIRRAPAEE
jgi:hypothetical protein